MICHIAAAFLTLLAAPVGRLIDYHHARLMRDIKRNELETP
jgi:hypothetical protein